MVILHGMKLPENQLTDGNRKKHISGHNNKEWIWKEIRISLSSYYLDVMYMLYLYFIHSYADNLDK